MLMRYLTVYYHRCGRGKEAGLQSDRIYVLTRFENKYRNIYSSDYFRR